MHRRGTATFLRVGGKVSARHTLFGADGYQSWSIEVLRTAWTTARLERAVIRASGTRTIARFEDDDPRWSTSRNSFFKRKRLAGLKLETELPPRVQVI